MSHAASAEHAADDDEGELRQAGNQRRGRSSAPAPMASGRARASSWRGDVLAEVGLGGGAGGDEAARHRDEQRRDGGDEALADGQDGEGLRPRPASSIPCCITPMIRPATMLTAVMSIAAIASRWVKRMAPSIAP